MTDKKLPKISTIVAVMVAVILLLLCGFIGSYNGMNAQRNDVDEKWAQVENVMQRRNDLIPNLVATVKGEMANEQKIFADIANSRKMYSKATSPNEQLAASDQLTGQTTILLNVIKESYPDLASSESVKTLMTQLEGTENRISVERKRYIEDVSAYNRTVTSFPNNLIANMFGFQKIDQYRASAGADKAPVVDFAN